MVKLSCCGKGVVQENLQAKYYTEKEAIMFRDVIELFTYLFNIFCQLKCEMERYMKPNRELNALSG